MNAFVGDAKYLRQPRRLIPSMDRAIPYLQIAMNNTSLVAVVDGLDEGSHTPTCFFFRVNFALDNFVEKLPTVSHFQNKIVVLVILEVAFELDQVRMTSKLQGAYKYNYDVEGKGSINISTIWSVVERPRGSNKHGAEPIARVPCSLRASQSRRPRDPLLSYRP